MTLSPSPFPVPVECSLLIAVLLNNFPGGEGAVDVFRGDTALSERCLIETLTVYIEVDLLFPQIVIEYTQL